MERRGDLNTLWWMPLHWAMHRYFFNTTFRYFFKAKMQRTPQGVIVNMAFRDECNILDQIYEKNIMLNLKKP